MKPGVLQRSGPIRRRAHSDPVSPELRIAVLERDGGCVADWAALRGIWDGTTFDPLWDPCHGRLTLDHVQDGYGRMGKRAPSDAAHLVSLCTHHHLDGFATSHRPALRRYLGEVS